MNNIYEAPQADLTPKQPVGETNELTQAMIDGLETGGKWAKFLAIIGYIAAALTAIAALFAVMGVFTIGFVGLVMLVAYAVSAYLTYRISSFVYRYSKSIEALTEYGDMGDMLEAQEHFNCYVKWMGIIMLIWAVLMGLFFVLGLAGFAFISDMI